MDIRMSWVAEWAEIGKNQGSADVFDQDKPSRQT